MKYSLYTILHYTTLHYDYDYDYDYDYYYYYYYDDDDYYQFPRLSSNRLLSGTR